MKKGKAVVIWTVTVLLSIIYVLAGFPKLMGSALLADRFVDLGYDYQFMKMVGLIELACGVLLLIPRVAFYSTALLIVVMIGAIVTHIRIDEFPQLVLPLAMIVPLAIIARVRWQSRWR
jgi:uncharacterized membrane protein YphA (DoxX/SURF4 family)